MEINTASSSIPIANETQIREFRGIAGTLRKNQTGHAKTHNAIIPEASSLNKALTKTTIMNKPAVTTMPVAKDARRSFMSRLSDSLTESGPGEY